MNKTKISSSPVISKIIAGFTLLVFSTTQITYAQGPLHIPLPTEQKMGIPLPEHLNIPDTIGSIQEEFMAEKKGPFVVFIQDCKTNTVFVLWHWREARGGWTRRCCALFRTAISRNM